MNTRSTIQEHYFIIEVFDGEKWEDWTETVSGEQKKYLSITQAEEEAERLARETASFYKEFRVVEMNVVTEITIRDSFKRNDK